MTPPMLGFTMFRDQIESGQKRLTIRQPRKHPIKVEDKLYLYWKLRTKQCRPLLAGEDIRCQAIERRQWKDMKYDGRLAQADGFRFLADFAIFFEKRYHPQDNTEFDIIGW